MTDPEVIIEDLAKAKIYLTEKVGDNIYEYEIGLKPCKCELPIQCLLYITRALDFRIEFDKFDELTESLYRCMMKIIGNYTAPTLSRFYYGYKVSADPLTLGEIVVSSYIEAIPGSNPVIPYVVPEDALYAWMAEPITEPLKTKWQDIVVSFNKGDIGTIDDTFGPVTTVSSTFRFYDTQFPTQFSYGIQFKVS